MRTKPDFTAFASASGRHHPVEGQANDTKHLQVRLLRIDAVRLRRTAEARGQTIQSALVEAVNLYFRDAGEVPASDPGTGSPKQS